MKNQAILLFFLFSLPSLLPAQRFQFMDANDAESFLEGILLEFGLTTDDIRITPSSRTRYAAADVENERRYIYYNPDWMRNIGSTYGDSEYWLKMGTITHELGHHMKGHTITSGSSALPLELEADWWAGFAMRKLGATLEEALTAVRKVSNSFATPTHPARRDREKAVTAGYRGGSYVPTVTLHGETYSIQYFDGLTWMTKNLDYKVYDSWCYNNDPANCAKYGRLYTWEAAKKACAAVGWRLPTDQEWRGLAVRFGGEYDYFDDDYPDEDAGKAAYQAMIKGGKSGFSARLGGYRYSGGGFYPLGNGYYWSATEVAIDYVLYYRFERNSGRLFRDYTPKGGGGKSCRCVQGAPSNGID